MFRKLVEDAKAGCFVAPENPESFNAVIRNYIQNPSQLKQEGENGYNFAKKNFDREKLAVNYIKEIQKIIKD